MRACHTFCRYRMISLSNAGSSMWNRAHAGNAIARFAVRHWAGAAVLSIGVAVAEGLLPFFVLAVRLSLNHGDHLAFSTLDPRFNNLQRNSACLKFCCVIDDYILSHLTHVALWDALHAPPGF